MRAFLPLPLFGPEDGGGAPAAPVAPAAATPAAPAATPAAAAATPAASATAWYDAAEGLTAGLSHEQRTFLAGKRPPDFQTFVTSAMEADRLARDRNVLPKPDPQKLGDWPGWQDLGWTPDRGAYLLKKPQTPEGMPYDEGFAKTVTDLAHEARMPVAAAQRMLDGLTRYAVDRITELDATGARAGQELDARLRQDWGQDYDRNAELAKRAGRFLGIGLDDGAELERIVGAPRMMQLFHRIGSMLGEDRLVSSGGDTGFGAMSLSQIDAELNRFAGDPEWMRAFNDPRHPRHADVKAQRDQLLAKKARLAA